MDKSLQKLVVNKVKANKKNYVPNLSVSRNIQPKESAEVKPTPILKKKESANRDNPRSRREHKLLAPVETIVPATNPSRNVLSVKLKSKIVSFTAGVKQESIDIEKVFNKRLPEKFEGISSASSQDLPVSIPKSRSSIPTMKINPLLGDILKLEDGESPLFLMKTPKYIPSELDKSETHPKIANHAGYKCTIHDLPEGQIGKLQILKSGKLRLVLGDCKFWLNRGVKVDFREELAIVKTDPEARKGEIISLGEIKERIMVVPDVVSKLKS